MISTERRVITVIAQQLRIEEDDVSLDASISRDLGGDSRDAVQIVMALEDVFGVEIPDEDAAGMSTVQEVIEYVTQALDNGAGTSSSAPSRDRG